MDAIYGTTRDGWTAASIGTEHYAMKPAGDQYKIVYGSCYYSPKTLAELSANDFFTNEGFVADEAGFRAQIDALLEHKRQLAQLHRTKLREMIDTPWGTSDNRYRYADGVEIVHTPGHGGIMLSPERNAKVHQAWRSRDAAYEEDCDWAIAALTFPELFTDRELASAHRTARNYYPEAYQTVFGVALTAADSNAIAEREFRSANAGNWVVISALRVEGDPLLVKAVATLGGDRSNPTAQFIVPADEYETRPKFGFVIDPARHQRAA